MNKNDMENYYVFLGMCCGLIIASIIKYFIDKRYKQKLFKNMKAFYNLDEAKEFAQNNPGDCRCVFSTKHKSYTWDDDGNEKEMLIFAGPYIVAKNWDSAQEFCNNRSLAYLQIYGEITCGQ